MASDVWKINDYHFVSPYYQLIINFLILYRLILMTFLFSPIWALNAPGTRQSTQLNFHLKNLSNFWMLLGEERKIGLVLSVYYILFVLFGSSWWLCAINNQTPMATHGPPCIRNQRQNAVHGRPQMRGWESPKWEEGKAQTGGRKTHSVWEEENK